MCPVVVTRAVAASDWPSAFVSAIVILFALACKQYQDRQRARHTLSCDSQDGSRNRLEQYIKKKGSGRLTLPKQANSKWVRSDQVKVPWWRQSWLDVADIALCRFKCFPYLCAFCGAYERRFVFCVRFDALWHEGSCICAAWRLFLVFLSAKCLSARGS